MAGVPPGCCPSLSFSSCSRSISACRRSRSSSESVVVAAPVAWPPGCCCLAGRRRAARQALGRRERRADPAHDRVEGELHGARIGQFENGDRRSVGRQQRLAIVGGPAFPPRSHETAGHGRGVARQLARLQHDAAQARRVEAGGICDRANLHHGFDRARREGHAAAGARGSGGEQIGGVVDSGAPSGVAPLAPALPECGLDRGSGAGS